MMLYAGKGYKIDNKITDQVLVVWKLIFTQTERAKCWMANFPMSKLIWFVLQMLLIFLWVVIAWFWVDVMDVFFVNPFPHIDAFWRLCSRRLFGKHSDKRRNCTESAISPFATIFSTLSHRLSIQLWRFSMFWQNTFKVVCCRIVVWGKGLTPWPDWTLF